MNAHARLILAPYLLGTTLLVTFASPRAYSLEKFLSCVRDSVEKTEANDNDFVRSHQKSNISEAEQLSYIRGQAHSDPNHMVIYDIDNEVKAMNDFFMENRGGKEAVNAVVHLRFNLLRNILESDPILKGQLPAVYNDFKTGRIEAGQVFSELLENPKTRGHFIQLLDQFNRDFWNHPFMQNLIHNMRKSGMSEANIERFEKSFSTGIGPDDTHAAIAARVARVTNSKSQVAVFDEKTGGFLNKTLTEIHKQSRVLNSLMSNPFRDERLFSILRASSTEDDPELAVYKALLVYHQEISPTQFHSIFDSIKRLQDKVKFFESERLIPKTSPIDYGHPEKGDLLNADMRNLGAFDLLAKARALLWARTPEEAIKLCKEAEKEVTDYKEKGFSQLKNILEADTQTSGDDFAARKANLSIPEVLKKLRNQGVPPNRFRFVKVKAGALAKIENVRGMSSVEYVGGIEKTLKDAGKSLAGTSAERIWNRTYIVPEVIPGPHGLEVVLHFDSGESSLVFSAFKAKFKNTFADFLQKNFPAKRFNDLPISMSELQPKTLRPNDRSTASAPQYH